MSKKFEIFLDKIDEKEDSNVKHYGYLLKRSRYLMNWNWRYTILTDRELLTYKDMDEGAEPTCVWSTTIIKDVREYVSLSQRNHGFIIESSSENVYFEAESIGKRNDWINSIKKLIYSKRNFKYPIYYASFNDKFNNSYNYEYQHIQKKEIKFQYLKIHYNNEKNINKLNIIEIKSKHKLNNLTPKTSFKPISCPTNFSLKTNSIKDKDLNLNSFVQSESSNLSKRFQKAEKESKLRMKSVREQCYEEDPIISPRFDSDTIKNTNINKMISSKSIPNIPKISNLLIPTIPIGENIPKIPVIPDITAEKVIVGNNIPNLPIQNITGLKVPNIPNVNNKIPNIPNVNNKIPNIPNVNNNIVPNIPVVNNIPNINNKMTNIPSVNNIPNINNKMPNIPSVNNKVPNIPAINQNGNHQSPAIPNRIRSNSMQVLENSFFKLSYSEIYPMYQEAKLALKTKFKHLKFTTFNWSEISINKKNIHNIFNDQKKENDIIYGDFLQNKYIFFLESFSYEEREKTKILEKEEISYFNSTNIKQLFALKELFSAKLSQSFLITIAKLKKTHPDIIQKLKEISSEITIEDLNSITDLFSARSKNKSELDELINYQELHKLEFDQYRASEKFVLEVYYNIYPHQFVEKITEHIPRLEYTDARLKTWKYALDFKQAFDYILNIRDNIQQVITIIKSTAITDVVRLSLFYGNLLNASKEGYKEIKAIQLETLFKLFKYKNKDDNYFFDQILMQLDHHMNYIEHIPMDKICMCFDESNSGMRSILSMINDFIKEYDANILMINRIKRFDIKYKVFMEKVFSSKTIEQAESVKGFCGQIEKNVKELYLWFGYKEDSSECKKMDPIFKTCSLFISHLQSRITVIRQLEQAVEESLDSINEMDNKIIRNMQRKSSSRCHLRTTFEK